MRGESRMMVVTSDKTAMESMKSTIYQRILHNEDRPLEILQEWGPQQDEVKFVLRYTVLPQPTQSTRLSPPLTLNFVMFKMPCRNSFVDGVDGGGGCGCGCGSDCVRRTAGPSQRSPRRDFLTANPTAPHDRTLSA
ncbi:hypothetical protein RUM43_011631 [Polyplax serrata]|uniref:Apoptosis-stimulating of p53 protein 2-like RA domain-containing protein n=1 Tax=Polyplax serrata TaxID=468196 RepID=A0AAN8NMP5_POLSC